MKRTSVALMVDVDHASVVHAFLKEHGLLLRTLKPKHSDDKVLFPLTCSSQKEARKALAQLGVGEIVKDSFVVRKMKPRTLRDALAPYLSPAQLDELITSYDVVGSIAIIQIPKALQSYERHIGDAVLKVQPNVRTVCRVVEPHHSEYRIRSVKVIAGKNSTITVHKEFGCKFIVDVAKVFFSPRLATERMRICRQIKKDELVAVPFAGVGPYPIIFAKHSPIKHAYAVELNPHAYKLLVENVALNHVQDKVTPIKGDAREVLREELRNRCSRVVMPMPKGGELFLEHAFDALRDQRGIVHIYQFQPKQSPFNELINKVKEAARKHGLRCTILNKRVVRPYSAALVQVALDFMVEKECNKH
jgi:tRNA (guanine37-N1)-methyltransferase